MMSEKDLEREGANGRPGDGWQYARLLEQERELIGMDLHDGLVQQITGARMQLESLLISGKLSPGPVRDTISDVVSLLRKAVEEARRVILGLRPPMLEDQGLVGAIEQLVAERKPGEPQVELRVPEPLGRLGPVVEAAVYRIVQEAVTNARKHSRSERVEVSLREAAGRLEVRVEDWGVGFDPAQVKGRGLGLQGICRRARLLGGLAEVHSAPGQGTRIAVSLPLASGPTGTVCDQ